MSVLRATQTLTIFSTRHMGMEVGNPLAAGNGQVQVLDALVEVHRDTVPKEFRIFIDEIGGGRGSELPFHAYFFKFIEKRVYLLCVHWISKLSDQVGCLNQTGQYICVRRLSLGRRWEASIFNCCRTSLCVNYGGIS